jgi:hypothetical protein
MNSSDELQKLLVRIACGMGMAFVVLWCCAASGMASGWSVHADTGSETANGRSAEIKEGDDPFRTIARADATAMEDLTPEAKAGGSPRSDGAAMVPQ